MGKVYFYILFIIIDPITYCIVFNSLTKNKEFNKKLIISVKSSILSSTLHILSILFGKSLLNLIDIPIYSLKITGGLSLLNTSYLIINSKNNDYHLIDENRSIYIYPLSTGLLAGPGTLCSLIILSNNCIIPLDYLIIGLSSTSILFLCFIGTLFSKYLSKINNELLDIINNMIGMLLASLAIYFIIESILTI